MIKRKTSVGMTFRTEKELNDYMQGKNLGNLGFGTTVGQVAKNYSKLLKKYKYEE